MREIKFRGKSKNEWVYGHLLKTEEDDYGEYGKVNGRKNNKNKHE